MAAWAAPLVSAGLGLYRALAPRMPQIARFADRAQDALGSAYDMRDAYGQFANSDADQDRQPSGGLLLRAMTGDPGANRVFIEDPAYYAPVAPPQYPDAVDARDVQRLIDMGLYVPGLHEYRNF